MALLIKICVGQRDIALLIKTYVGQRDIFFAGFLVIQSCRAADGNC